MRRVILRSCTFWIFCLCVLLFLLNEKESISIKKTSGELALSVGLTPVQRNLFFDYPETMAAMEKVITRYNIRSAEDLSDLTPPGQRQLRKAERIPMWSGLVTELRTGGIDKDTPLFEKIRRGQVWRFFSPSFLHKDLFHLIFNMGWLWLLGLQIEKRIGRVRFISLILFIAALSNTAQYLMGGPYFLGFSGVVVGLTGFIWMRQRRAPTEGYPLPRATALFVFYFVLAMMVLEWIGLAIQTIFSIVIPLNIANTAHVAGGIAGLIPGRCGFFSRRAV